MKNRLRRRAQMWSVLALLATAASWGASPTARFSDASRGRGDELSSRGRSASTASKSDSPAVARIRQAVGPAAITVYGTRLAFQTDHPGLPLEDFEDGSAPAGGFSTCDAPLDDTGDAACGFAPGEILSGIQFQDNPGPGSGSLLLIGVGTILNPTQLVIANTFADAFDALFDPPVGAVAMDLHSSPAPGSGPPDELTIQVFDASDVLIDTAFLNVAASGPGNFWGISSTIPIGRISMLSENNQAEGVDNIEFGESLQADLAIVKTSDAGAEVAPGGTVVFTLVVTNNGTASADSIVVTDSLPAGLSYVSNDCAASFADPTLTWNVGTLADDGTATCNVTTTVDDDAAPGALVNTASVTSAASDPVSSNDSSASTINVGVPLAPAAPTLGGVAMAILLLALGASALLVLRRT